MATARQFDHALIARQQAALVATIARDVQEGHARPDHLDAYRASIRQERQFLNRAQQRQQEAEMARADALIALTRQVGGRERLIAMVAAIAADEQREVERARADLDHIRNRAMVLGALLAMTAMGVAVAGGVLLLRANRDLAGEVAARTAELRAIDSSRRLFFAKASHEMRTPVTAIRAIAEVALDSGDTSPAPLRNITAQTIFLGHRIEEMLALSQAAQGRPIMALALVDLADVVEDAAARSLPYAQSVQVAIRCDAAMAHPAIGDRRWLGQALVAILDNGIKFSDPGGVLAISFP
jgi:signal transduction histidine kinase